MVLQCVGGWLPGDGVAEVVLYSLHRDSRSALASDWLSVRLLVSDALRLTVSLLFLPRLAREMPLPYKNQN